MRYLIAALLVLVPAAVGAWTLTSDPSPQNATQWKVTLSNGTVYQGETVNNTVAWPIDQLGPGVYRGDTYFGAPEWTVLTNGTVTDNSTMIWSDPMPFTLKRRGHSGKVPKLEIQ